MRSGMRVWQRVEQDRVDDTEDRRRRADSNGQRQRRDDREAGRRAKSSRGVAEVGERRVDRILPAVAANLLAHARVAAHLEPSDALRIVDRHATSHVLGDTLFVIVLNFVADVAIGGGAVDERADAARQLSRADHGITPRP